MEKMYRKQYAAVAVLMLAAVCSAEVNLLKNGSFEAGTPPWQVTEWSSPSGTAAYRVTADHVCDGKGAAEVRHVSGNSNILLGQKVTIAGQHDLMLTFYALADVAPGLNAPIGACFVSQDKNGKKLQYLHKPLTAGDHWEKYTWQFRTHPDTASLTVYLRSGKERIWFDNAVLNIFSGPSLTDLQFWYPTKEIIPTLLPSGTGQNEVTATIKDVAGKRVVYSGKLKLGGGKNFPVLKTKDISPGLWVLEIVDAQGSSISEKFVWPEEAPQTVGRKNNFVTVLRQNSAVEIGPERPVVFTNPRAGWLCLKLRAENDAVLTLDGSSVKRIELKGGESSEIMCSAPRGSLKLLAANPVKLTECEIRTMAELIFCEYEGMESRKMFAGLMHGPAGQAMLRNTNVIMEGFDRAYTLETELLPESSAECIARWRASGKKLISHTLRPSTRGTIKPKDSAAYWSSRIGMRLFDGIAVDEFANETPEELKDYCTAIQAIQANPALRGKAFYAYSCAAWDEHERSKEFRKHLLAGNGFFAPEFYLREKRSIGEAKSYINQMFGYLRSWPDTLPGSLNRLVVVLASTDGLPSYYGQDTFANVQYKYFLDLQYNILANDPAFQDLRGVTAWILRYTKPETVAWLAILNRHYCIEGNRDMLSDRLGYQFGLSYLNNPDFRNGLAGWRAEPAEQGSLSHKRLSGWGFGRGTCNTPPDGDDGIVMKRVPGKTNFLRQPIVGLKPGHWYEISCRVADYDDIAEGRAERKLLPLSITLSEHVFAQGISLIDVYRSAHNMEPKFPTFYQGPCANEQRLFFQAKHPSALLTISDGCVTAGIKAGNSTDMPFASPPPDEVKNMIINFIQVQEVLPPKQWHGAYSDR